MTQKNILYEHKRIIISSSYLKHFPGKLFRFYSNSFVMNVMFSDMLFT